MNDIHDNFPRLDIDDEFAYLKHPLNEDGFANLKDSILADGCMQPILVWHGLIIDGIKRYQICKEYGISFLIKHPSLLSRDAAIAYICRLELKKDDLVNERYKYLIGRLYQSEIEVKAQVYMHFSNQRNESTRPYVPGKAYRKQEVSQEIADHFNISRGTVLKYDIFTKCVDSLREKEPAISAKILSGKLKISHENIIELERLPVRDLKALNETLSKSHIDHITYSDIRHELIWKTVPQPPNYPTRQQEDPNLPIRQMPAYDPDASLATLIYTIPTWISSIERSYAATDFVKATAGAKEKVQGKLSSLKEAIAKMEASLKEEPENARSLSVRTESLLRTDSYQGFGLKSGLSETPVNETRTESSCPLRSIPDQSGEG